MIVFLKSRGVSLSMIVKVHKRQDKTVVAVCDTNLIGKKFEDGDLQLDLGSDFYKGEEMDEKEAGDLVRNADIINLAGEESIRLGLAEGVIDEEHVLKIKGIPHAQAVLEH